MERAEEGHGAGQELVQKRPRVHRGTLMCGGDRKLETGSEGQPREAGVCGEQRAARRGPHSRPCSWRPSLHALGPLPPALTSAAYAGSLATLSPQAEGTQVRALSRAPLCGSPRGRDLENCLGTLQRAPTPWQRPAPSLVAAVTRPRSWIWTPGGNMHFQLRPQHGSRSRWLGLSCVPQAAACGPNA